MAKGPVFDHRPLRPIRGEVLLDDATKRRIGRRRLRRVGAGCAVIAIVGAMVAVYVSPIVRVSDVKVEGASEATAAQLDGLIDLDGESMFTVDFDETRAQMAAIPMIKSVEFKREWPQTVKIIVTERTAWGVWMLGDTPYVIDEDGVVLGGVSPPENSVVIYAPASDGLLTAGNRVGGDAGALVRAMIERVPIVAQVGLTTFEWSNASGLTLTTDAGYRVVIGESENWEYKLAVWQQIQEQVGRDAMAGQVLDLRFGDRPALRSLTTPAPAPSSAPSPTPSEVTE